jgi:hypothetical protein
MNIDAIQDLTRHGFLGFDNNSSRTPTGFLCFADNHALIDRLSCVIAARIKL